MRHKGIATLSALLAAGVISTAALGATNPVIDWSGPESAAYEPAFSMPFTSTAGNELTIVGKIQLFQAPLAGFNAGDVTREYTFVFDDLISQGTVDLGPVRRTNYTGGRWRVFEDLSPDRNFGVNPPNATSPSTFEDGTVILEGTFSGFYTQSNEIGNSGNYNADLLVTGGSAYNLMAQDGSLCGYLIGVWNRTSGAFPTGYIRSADGKLDFFGCPVPVESSTWSRVKRLVNE
jgi:hypothetical protein